MTGFDERYFLHVEDIEICRRARQMGGQVGFVPGAVVMHYGSTSDVPRIWIENEKLKGFLRYFWNYTPGIMPKILTILAAPVLSVYSGCAAPGRTSQGCSSKITRVILLPLE